MKTQQELMKALAQVTGLMFDGGCAENRLHCDNEPITVFGQLMTRREYKAMEKAINACVVKGAGFIVYAWNDSSGYDYWSQDNGDSNYIQVTAAIANLRIVDTDELKRAVELVYCSLRYYDNSNEFYSREMDKEEQRI